MSVEKVSGIGCFLVCGIIAVMVGLSGLREQGYAEAIRTDATSFVSGGGFMATAKLDGRGEPTVTSRHFGNPCLGYHTVVERHVLTTEPDGDEKESVYVIFEDSDKVPGLDVVFKEGKAELDLLTIEKHYGEKREDLNECPDYVPLELRAKPEKILKGTWWVVREATYTADREYFVVANRGDGGFLAPHPQFETVIVFPGTRQELAESFQSSGNFNLIGTVLLLVLGIGAGLGINSTGNTSFQDFLGSSEEAKKTS